MPEFNSDLSLFVYVRTSERLYKNGEINDMFRSLREGVMIEFAKLINTYNFSTPSNLTEYKITTNEEPLPVDNVLCLMVTIDTYADETDTNLKNFIKELVSETFKMNGKVVGVIIKKHNPRELFIQCFDDCTNDERQLIVHKWKTL